MKPSIARPVLLLASALLLGSCSWFHHGGKHGCRERDVAAGAIDRPALKVPPGDDAPDTRNAVKVPPLTEPEKPRSKSDPCLSAPPSFKG